MPFWPGFAHWHCFGGSDEAEVDDLLAELALTIPQTN